MSKVFVGGIQWETTVDQVATVFRQFGTVINTTIMIDKLTGKSRGFGFITFDTPESASRALNHNQPIYLNGRSLDVKIALTKETATPQYQCKKVFIGGLPNMTDADLNEYFSQFGRVIAAWIPLCPTGRSRGFGFVTFDSPETVQVVLNTTHVINNKTVEVKRATPRGAPELANTQPPQHCPQYIGLSVTTPYSIPDNGWSMYVGAHNIPPTTYQHWRQIPTTPYTLGVHSRTPSHYNNICGNPQYAGDVMSQIDDSTFFGHPHQQQAEQYVPQPIPGFTPIDTTW